MNLVAIEVPAAGGAASREALEFFDAALGVISAGDGLQVVADELVQAFAEGFGFLAGAGDELVVNGEGDVHRCIPYTVYVDTGYVSNGARSKSPSCLAKNARQGRGTSGSLLIESVAGGDGT